MYRIPHLFPQTSGPDIDHALPLLLRHCPTSLSQTVLMSILGDPAKKGQLHEIHLCVECPCAVFSFGGSALAEPSSPSCEIVLEKIDTARKALVPFRRPMEMARAREYGANTKSMACVVGGPFWW